MNKSHRLYLQSAFFIFLTLLSSSILSGCNATHTTKTIAPELLPPIRVTLVTPDQVSKTQLSPGLSVIYLDKFYRTMDQMPDPDKAAAKGRQGTSILQLNHTFAKDELVFDSGEKTGIGMVMTGYLYLATPGEYRFQALSNDGIECVLGKKLLFVDPAVHKDRLSPIGIAEISQGGWYPLTLRYFQRKGTATLKFLWQPPGATAFSPIPKDIYGHMSHESP